MANGDTHNTLGHMSANANGAIGAGLGVAHNGVDANNAPRVKKATVSKNAAVASIDRPAGVNPDIDVADLGQVSYSSVYGSRVLVKGGALVNADVDVMVDGNGKFITATYTADQYTQLWGRSVDGCPADGDWFTIVFMPQLVYTKA